MQRVHPSPKLQAKKSLQFLAFLGMKSTRKPMKLPPYVASILNPYNLCLPSRPLIDLQASMSGQPPSSPAMPPPQPQPFRFWLPYRSNVALSRHQPRPMPPPPPPTPAETAPRQSPAPAVVEDIPIQAESSHDEPDTIPVQTLDSLRMRGARTSMADLELTLSRSPPPLPPPGQEQGPSRDSDRGNDTKISISGFPRERLFDGARAPYRREIEDGLKSLASRETPAPRPPDGGNQGYRVITLAGHNVGASMVLGNGPREAPLPTDASKSEGSARMPAVATNVNSNVQSVNNSAMEGSTCNAGDPGVHVDIKNAREDRVALAPSKEEEKPAKAPPPVVNSTAASGVETAAVQTPPRTRRCLRALMLETRKPKPTACRFQCVADHTKPPPPPSDSGKTAEDGAGGSTT